MYSLCERQRQEPVEDILGLYKQRRSMTENEWEMKILFVFPGEKIACDPDCTNITGVLRICIVHKFIFKVQYRRYISNSKVSWRPDATYSAIIVIQEVTL